MNIWALCHGITHRKPMKANAWRVVEAQHVSSSRDLVDTLEEHELLEDLLEASKPAMDTCQHYLIFTPFRYPPLKYGSRFGHAFEPSLWYGSHDLETAFCEVAYYRLKFFSDTSANLGSSEIPMTVFSACLESQASVDLTAPPFSDYQHLISHQETYAYSQTLGTQMRQAGIEMFYFSSARSTHQGKNIAAFTPTIFIKRNNQYITGMQSWRCFANKKSIEFWNGDSRRPTYSYRLTIEQGINQ